MKKQKVAIVYDRVNKWGGAERVLLALHEIFPEAPLYTSLYDKNKASWAKIFPKINTSFLQKFPFAKSNHEFLPLLMPIAFQSFDFNEFDIVISVTSEAAKGIKIPSKTIHISYILTPTRYLWSHHKEYFKNPALKFIAKPIVEYLRKWDKDAAAQPTEIVAISKEVQNRVKKYYNRESVIIFPPVSTTLIHINRVKNPKYYLIVSRLDYGYKKVELAIEAFNQTGKNLVIVGAGREKKKLEKMAKKNIKFVGHVSEKKLATYYHGAKALIMPQEEDFGIVSVEAQAHRVPVIAFKKGGAIDTVIPGKTGIFFDYQKPESLIEAINKFEKMKFVSKNLSMNAKKFSKKNFKIRLLALVNKYNRI